MEGKIGADGITFGVEGENKIKYGFLGLPYDQGDVGGFPGSRLGPDAVRPYINKTFCDVKSDNYIVDCDEWKLIDAGNLHIKDFKDVDTFKYFDMEGSVKLFASHVTEIVNKGYLPLVCGGDCSINYSAVKGIHDSMTDGKLGVIYMDAHPDIWSNNEYSRFGDYSHCSPFRKCIELDRVDGSNTVHFGVRGYRSHDSLYEIEYMKEHNVTVIPYARLKREGVVKIAKRMLEVVKKGTDKIALALDIDVIEQIFAPGSSSNETGGPMGWEMRELLKELAPEIDCFSISEVNPLTDVNGMTSRLAGDLFTTYILENYKSKL